MGFEGIIFQPHSRVPEAINIIPVETFVGFTQLVVLRHPAIVIQILLIHLQTFEI